MSSFFCHNFAKNGAIEFKFGVSRADSYITYMSVLILKVVGIFRVLYFYSFDGQNQFLFGNKS